jgi:hypothetical protein
MRLRSLLNAVVCLTLVSTSFVQAGALDKIDRPLVKEPAYSSKSPKYALLVFGPEARTRIWLVLDGTTLYVDRNGNGDLTEDREKVAGTKSTLRDEDAYTFAIGELRDGDRRHRNAALTVTDVKASPGRGPRKMGFSLRMDVEIPGYHGVGEGGRVLQMAVTSDLDGELQFSDRPQDAPVLHFGGPWTISLYDRPTFRVNRELEMYLALGTPGRGKGTFVWTAYEGVIPPDVSPTAEIAFPASKPGEPAVKVVYPLKGRC